MKGYEELFCHHGDLEWQDILALSTRCLHCSRYRVNVNPGLLSETDVSGKAFYGDKEDIILCFLIFAPHQWQFTYFLAAAQHHSFSSAPPAGDCLEAQEDGHSCAAPSH